MSSLPRKITIEDVAQRAGVAISSVSRVLNNHPNVTEELRLRVEKAVDELGYSADIRGSSLRRGKTGTVGYLVGNLTNPITAIIAQAATRVLADHGYMMNVVCSQNDPHLDVMFLKVMQQRQVEGLICMPANREPDLASGLILEQKIPTVMVDRDVLDAPHVSAVYVEHQSGIVSAVQHLARQGHRSIGYIGGPRFLLAGRERLAGFQRGMTEMDLTIDENLIRVGDFDEQTGYIETLNLLSRQKHPTALIAAGNSILVGMLQALMEREMVIGRDIALIGADNLDVARLYNPPITVIGRDIVRMGEVAARLLLDAMQGSGSKTVILPTNLIVRASSIGTAALENGRMKVSGNGS